MERLRLATVWLGGCSGCHMSLLDMDEFLLDLGDMADVVFSPIVDTKEFPEGVDVTLVEGAVCNDEHLEMIRLVRQRSRVLVALGDCAVTGNVSGIRNAIGDARSVLERSYPERSQPRGSIPHATDLVPRLLDRVVPIHEVVHVDEFLPGCPPSGPAIRVAIEALIDGRPIEPSEHCSPFGGHGLRSG
jgi:NAD-reducing hydrogenase small subunit